jgi:hypothetical protein
VKCIIPLEYKKLMDKSISFEKFRELLINIHNKEINRYYSIIEKSDLAELLPFVKENLYTKRLAYTINHPTNLIFMEIYVIILRKYFGLNISPEVLNINNIDFLKNDHIDTVLTSYDKICLGFNIDEHYLDVRNSDNYLSK